MSKRLTEKDLMYECGHIINPAQESNLQAHIDNIILIQGDCRQCTGIPVAGDKVIGFYPELAKSYYDWWQRVLIEVEGE